MDIINKIKICNNCYYNVQCINCFNINETILTDKQNQILNKINNDCFENNNSNLYGLYGQAGTGKTLLISHLIKNANLYELFISKYICNKLNIPKINNNYKLNNDELEKIEYIKFDYNKINVIVSAPTHKALNVLREKLEGIEISKNIKLEFNTVSQLLTHRAKNSWNGDKIFKRQGLSKNIFDYYDLIIIDECSMLSKYNIEDIKKDYELSKIKKCYIVFIGDKSQLPPVGESLSTIFEYITNYSKLKIIKRTNSDNIINLAKYVRKNILNNPKISLKKEKLLTFQSSNIIFYSNSTEFINFYIKTYNHGNNIILTYTNNSKNNYNNKIIEQIPSDIYIFNDYFELESYKFYSSYRIFVSEEIETTFTNLKFNYILIKKNIDNDIKNRKIYHEILKDLNISVYYNYIFDCIEKLIININKIIPINYKINKIISGTLIDQNNIELPKNKLIYINKFDKLLFNLNNENIKKEILNFINDDNSIYNNIKKKLAKYIWDEYDRVIKYIFIDIDYSNSITVNKSQGSTYVNVFIDYRNIFFFNHNTEAKQRLYTAITRASDNIYILL